MGSPSAYSLRALETARGRGLLVAALSLALASCASAPPAAPDGAVTVAAPRGSTIDSYKYVGFEDRFRGAQAEIRQRMQDRQLASGEVLAAIRPSLFPGLFALAALALVHLASGSTWAARPVAGGPWEPPRGRREV